MLVVSARMRAIGAISKPSFERGIVDASAPEPAREISAWFEVGGWTPTPVFERAPWQPGVVLDGPAIVLEYDSTTVVLPGAALACGRARLADHRGGADMTDAVTHEVVRGSLRAIAQEMKVAVMRTAYSAVVASGGDMSAGLADRHGRVVAQGRDIPAQLGALPSSLDAMLGGLARPARARATR